MSKWSRTCRRCPTRYYPDDLRLLLMAPDKTSQPAVFGVEAMKGPSLTSGCSIPMLLPTDRQQQTKFFRKHEMEKKRAYEQRVREIEHASFTPLVLSASGGLAKEAWPPSWQRSGTIPTA